jgi:hypothetical protein
MSKYVKTFLNKSGAKRLSFQNGGEIMKVSILESELAKLPRSTSKQGDVYVNFEMSSLKNPTEYSTHSIYFSALEGAEVPTSQPSPGKTPTAQADTDW